MTIQTRAIDHVCLSVSSLERAKDQFERLFGAHVFPRENDPSTLVVSMGEVRFFLRLAGEEPLQFQHLSFRVDSLEMVELVLVEQNISFTKGTVNFFAQNNYHWIEWRDPDGIRLECVEVF